MSLILNTIAARMPREWPTWAMLVLCYGGWIGGLTLCATGWVWLGYPLLAVMAALHASLQHEALHGHPTRNAAINEALVFPPLALAFPYRRFKTLHLRHHCDERLTDPYDDPESWYRARSDWDRFPAPFRWILTINNAMAGRMIIGPLLMVAAFWLSEAKALRRGERGVACHRAGGAVSLGLSRFRQLASAIISVHPHIL
jgi:fatty acid desaturase